MPIKHPQTGHTLYTVADIAKAANCTTHNVHHHLREPIARGSWADQYPPQKVEGLSTTNYWTRDGLEAFVNMRNTKAGSHNAAKHITPRQFPAYRMRVEQGKVILRLRSGERVYRVQPSSVQGDYAAKDYDCQLATDDGRPSGETVRIGNRSYLYFREA